MTDFATLEDIETRYPRELIILAADEETGVRDDARVLAAIRDASVEVRAILRARYTTDDIARFDTDSRDALKVYTIDIALYRIALAFSRSNERIEERYKVALKRLEAIAQGKAALSFQDGTGGTPGEENLTSPNEVVLDAPERLFTRERMRGL